MNFYPHHIGDYLTATAHLSWLEDCAYRRLLDLYYSREQALPTEITQVCRLVRAISKEERKAVEVVLKEFFALSEDGWAHGRCELEIHKAKAAADRAKANGKKGGRPQQEKPKENPEITQPVISGLPNKTHEEPDPKAPITNPITNTSVSKDTDGVAVTFPENQTKVELWKSGKSLLREQGMPDTQCGTFVGKLCKDYGDETVIEAVRTAVVKQPVDAASYLKSECQRLKGDAKTTPSKHAGFKNLDYRKGIADDGSFD